MEGFMRLLILAAAVLCTATQAAAFCGFYVARADGALYNEASKVVFVRDGRQSTITMSSDYSGPASEFALIVPAPYVLSRDDIATVDPAIVDHLDGYTAPRLVEYFDGDPCLYEEGGLAIEIVEAPIGTDPEDWTPPNGPMALGVRVLAEYAVGDYDIVMLSAEQSDGLVTWLRQEGYSIPDGAEGALAGYIAMDMKFFVARVNLHRHAANETQDLPPLQISFRSRDFMLPLQLGKINSTGTQDMLMLFLTPEGQVTTDNYTNVWLPTDYNVPVFVEEVFPQFYRALFDATIAANTVVTEYAWDMAWCDPCAADPMTGAELRALGASWVTDDGPPEAYVTRMHVQYDRDTFMADLMFRVTGSSPNFQGRYVMNHPFEGPITCEAGQEYVARTRARIAEEGRTLRSLTGWGAETVARNIAITVPVRYR
jgi:hypothetical protein